MQHEAPAESRIIAANVAGRDAGMAGKAKEPPQLLSALQQYAWLKGWERGAAIWRAQRENVK